MSGGKPNPLSPEEYERLVATVSPRDQAFVEFVYCTGVSAHPAYDLQWEDVDLEAKTAFIRRSRTLAALSDRAVAALKPYRKASGQVFTNLGEPKWFEGIRRRLRTASVKAGLKTVSVYDIRSALPDHLEIKGADPRFVTALREVWQRRRYSADPDAIRNRPQNSNRDARGRLRKAHPQEHPQEPGPPAVDASGHKPL